MKACKYIIICLSVIFFASQIVTPAISQEITSDHLSQGNSFYFQGLPESALQEYQQALTFSPDIFETYANMAIIYRDLNLYPEAIVAYNKAIAITSEEPLLFSNLGWAYYNLSDFSNAYDYFQKTISLMTGVPDSPILCEAYFGLGSLYLSQKSYRTAEEKFQQALSANPNYAPAYFSLGLIYEAEDRFDEAIHNYIKTLEIDYNYVEAHFHLARLYLSKKLYEKSFKQYNKISNIDIKNKEAAQKKEEILTLLAKKPEEIITPRRIPKNSRVAPVAQAEVIPLIRIGIGVNERGQPLPKDKVYFKCGGPFKIVQKSDQGILTGGIIDGLWRIELKDTKDKLAVFDPQDRLVAECSQAVLIQLLDPKTQTIIIQNIGYGKGFHWGGEEDREYRGEIELSLNEKYGLQIINIVNVEEYLYSVLPSEMISSWPTEALKSQAVIARGEALYKQKYVRPHGDRYDLCDDQHCQVYRGVKNENKRTTEAVNATRGETLFYNDKIAHTLYSSNCGGHTQSSGELKDWGDEPYLQGVLDAPDDIPEPNSPWSLEKWIKTNPDVYCNIPRFCYPAEFRWVRIISAADLEERLNRTYNLGKIQAIRPLRRSKSGHINGLLIKGLKGEITLDKEHEIRRLLANGFLRSTLFVIETRFGEDRLPVEFTLYGGGWGHGVGMCQTGAAGMAYKEGSSYKEILQHYYKDTVLKKMNY